MKLIISHIFFFILTIFSQQIFGQIDSMSNHGENEPTTSQWKKPILKGNLSARLLYNNTNGIENRYENPTWHISGLPRLEWGDFKMPVRINAGNRENPFAQYYNKIGISPTYKWATLHLGYNNVHFSPFTLNGRTFVGAGIELTPSFLRIGAIYGRFQNPEEEKFDSNRQLIIPPRFERKGYAFKLGFGKEENYVDLLYFHAEDDSTSISFPDSSTTFPTQNTVIGISSQQKLWRVLHFDIDGGLSAFTRNQRSDTVTLAHDFWEDLFRKVITPRLSTHYHYALQGSLGLKLKNFGIETRYRRIDSDYRSMGIWFLLNDVEDITVSPNFNLFDRKFRLRARYGWQRNNLSGLRLANSFRQISSVNLQLAPNRNLNVQFNYANFHFDQTKHREWLSDTVLISRVTNRFSVGFRILFPSKRIGQTLSMNYTYRQLNRDTETDSERFQAKGYALRYNLRFTKTGLTLTPGLQYFEYSFPERTTERLNANLSINQSLFNRKLFAGYHFSYNLQFQNKTLDRTIWRYQLNVQYRLTDQLQFRLFVNLIRSEAEMPGMISFRETIGSLELEYRF